MEKNIQHHDVTLCPLHGPQSHARKMKAGRGRRDLTLAKLEGTVYRGREGVAPWNAWWWQGRRGGSVEDVVAAGKAWQQELGLALAPPSGSRG